MKLRLVEALTEDAENTFTSSVRDVSVYGLADNATAEDGSASITWEFMMEYRSFGVKDVDVVIRKLSAGWDVLNETTQKSAHQTLEYTAGDSSGWTVETESSPKSFPFSVHPTSVEIYPMERRVIVFF